MSPPNCYTQLTPLHLSFVVLAAGELPHGTMPYGKITGTAMRTGSSLFIRRQDLQECVAIAAALGGAQDLKDWQRQKLAAGEDCFEERKKLLAEGENLKIAAFSSACVMADLEVPLWK